MSRGRVRVAALAAADRRSENTSQRVIVLPTLCLSSRGPTAELRAFGVHHSQVASNMASAFFASAPSATFARLSAEEPPPAGEEEGGKAKARAVQPVVGTLSTRPRRESAACILRARAAPAPRPIAARPIHNAGVRAAARRERQRRAREEPRPTRARRRRATLSRARRNASSASNAAAGYVEGPREQEHAPCRNAGATFAFRATS